jgi:hypothetical protein
MNEFGLNLTPQDCYLKKRSAEPFVTDTAGRLFLYSISETPVYEYLSKHRFFAKMETRILH